MQGGRRRGVPSQLGLSGHQEWGLHTVQQQMDRAEGQADGRVDDGLCNPVAWLVCNVGTCSPYLQLPARATALILPVRLWAVHTAVFDMHRLTSRPSSSSPPPKRLAISASKSLVALTASSRASTLLPSSGRFASKMVPSCSLVVCKQTAHVSDAKATAHAGSPLCCLRIVSLFLTCHLYGTGQAVTLSAAQVSPAAQGQALTQWMRSVSWLAGPSGLLFKRMP